MNKKILLISFMGICSAPTPETTSVFVTTPLMMRIVHQYNRWEKTIVNLERAIYNAHHTSLPRQKAVFDFIYNLGDPERAKEEATKINQEFHIDSESPMYDDLVHAVRIKIKDINRYFYRSGKVNLWLIYELCPLMIPAIFETLHNTFNILSLKEYNFNIEYLLQTAELSIKLKNTSIHHTVKQIAHKTAQEALSILCLYNKNNECHQQIALAAVELGDKVIIDRVFQAWISESLEDIFSLASLIKVAEFAHKISNQEWENEAFEKAFATATKRNEMSGFAYISKEAHTIENEACARAAFYKALELLRNDGDYLRIAKAVFEMGNEEFINSAFEKVFKNINQIDLYLEMIKMARENKNGNWEDKIFEKALALSNSMGYHDEIFQLANEIKNIKYRDQAFEKMSAEASSHD